MRWKPVVSVGLRFRATIFESGGVGQNRQCVYNDCHYWPTLPKSHQARYPCARVLLRGQLVPFVIRVTAFSLVSFNHGLSQAD